MLSMASQQPKLDRAVTDSSVSYHNAPAQQIVSTPPSVQVQEEETTPTSETPARVITPIGTLSIRAAVSEPHGEEKEEHAAPVVGETPLLFLTHLSPPPSALKPKKVTSAKKKSTLGAKKLTVPNDSSSSSSKKGQDIRIETFESVEKKQQRAAAEEEDFALAQKLQKDEISKAGGNGGAAGVSRISSLLQEEEKSIYRSPYQAAAAPPTPPSGSVSYSSPYASLSGSNYSSSMYSSSAPAPPPATASGDMSKFSKSKGISSDQYFGRDLAEQEEHRKTLSKYSNSTSISSDMLYGQQQGGDQGRGYSTRESDNLGGLDFDRLKDSVKGFFDELR
jgi:hypothetical protein